MDNFSVVASLLLLGLFLISSPAEGYVHGYRYLDLSDQRLQSSPWRRLTRQEIMDAEIKTEQNRGDGKEGEFVFKTSDNEDMRSRQLNKKFDDENSHALPYPTDFQDKSEYKTLNTNKSNSDTTNSGKRTDNNENEMLAFTVIIPQPRH
ncbi:hypothetical protein PYW07_010765 [Mythimna separata]|uniref:Uncharacterized protein n=1 Tax=Mythimna separata TaxID=271217 RepID=A0AAD7Y8B2_MYTSE|nr:hypothetical protein PYW07_010765 [Mythimna separata]